MMMTDVSRTGGTKDKDVGPAVQRMRMTDVSRYKG